MIKILELPPELDDAVEKEDLVRVKRRGGSGFVFIVREETMEEFRRQMTIEGESDRSFYESEGEIPLEP